MTGTFDIRLLRICRSTRSSQQQAANSWVIFFLADAQQEMTNKLGQQP